VDDADRIRDHDWAMAKSSKGARNIVVEDVRYRWRATGNDGWISLDIWPDALPGPVIACTLGYNQTWEPIASDRWLLTKQLVVTSRVVRKVIEYAKRQRGYDPCTKGKPVMLRRLETMIDLSDALRSA
jgi:hypothetical protein